MAQADLTLDDGLHAVGVFRAEPETRSVADALEMYLRYAPASSGDVSWSVKAGAFFPTISLENDDLGWTSPYTLTPSAINSWIGEELRTIGSEGTLRWNTGSIGTLSLIGALYCCNDDAGVLMADRGWAMDDNPTGLFERVRIPDATLRLFHAPVPGNTGMFDEIDGNRRLVCGRCVADAGIGKLTVTRYDNQADPARPRPARQRLGHQILELRRAHPDRSGDADRPAAHRLYRTGFCRRRGRDQIPVRLPAGQHRSG